MAKEKHLISNIGLFWSAQQWNEASNAEITGPKITAVFDSRDGLSEAREYGVQK